MLGCLVHHYLPNVEPFSENSGFRTAATAVRIITVLVSQAPADELMGPTCGLRGAFDVQISQFPTTVTVLQKLLRHMGTQ